LRERALSRLEPVMNGPLVIGCFLIVEPQVELGVSTSGKANNINI
jgi:hypothetical protein